MSRKNTDDTAPQRDILAAAQSGDRLETLLALRDLLADRLQKTESSRDISAISRRLMQCVSEIETLEKIKQAEEESPFKLSDFRKIAAAKMTIDNQHKLNGIDSEHEVF